MTIASACNRELRMNRMVVNSIAAEPLWGWKKQDESVKSGATALMAGTLSSIASLHFHVGRGS